MWMGRLDADVNYWTDLLPGVLVFGLGLSATVAPLTNTVLGAVPQHNAGVASGVNNQVARVAALLAIAAVGAVVAARSSRSWAGVASTRCPAGRRRSSTLRSRPTARALLAGGLVVFGGVISLVGIVNPRREEREALSRATSSARCGSRSRARGGGAAAPREARRLRWPVGMGDRFTLSLRATGGWRTARSRRSC